MSTTSSLSSLSGVQTYEEATQASLYSTGTESTLGQDTFLKLLTTQLQHQDPLNPMDNTEFVMQLSQFSSLEQLTNANNKLEQLAAGMSSVGSATMVNMIGKDVRAVGNGFHHESGDKELHYDLASAAEQATVTITDSNGNVVLQKTMQNQQAGEQTFTWNGRNANGTPMPAGDYTFSVAATSGGESVAVTTYIQGLVDQIDYSTGVAAPRVDGQIVTVDKIVRVLEPEEAVTEVEDDAE